MQPIRAKLLLTLGLVIAAAPFTRAGTVFSPTSVTYNQAGDYCSCGADITSATVYNYGMQSGAAGLNTANPFTSGVTNWQTYFSGVGAYNANNPAGPLHTWVTYNPNYPTQPADYEWFGATGNTTNQELLLNMGSTQYWQALALWNEDAVGVGSIGVYLCTGGISGTTCLGSTSEGTFTPTPSANSDNSPLTCVAGDQSTYSGYTGCQYGAQLYSFTNPGFAQYIELVLNAPGGQNQISMGQVVFEGTTPEPATWGLMGLGLAGIGFRKWNARRVKGDSTHRGERS